jgi:hypothetical protein
MAGFGWPQAVVILSDREDVVAGKDPEFVPRWDAPNSVVWFEGGHERSFDVDAVAEETPESFVFRTKAGERFELRPMTLELYRKHVRARTIGKRDYATLGELLAAFDREW